MKWDTLRRISDEYAKKIGTSVRCEIGDGTGGLAMLCDDNTVIKATISIDETYAVRKIVGRKNKHIADYYDIVKFKSSRREYHVIHMEYLHIRDDIKPYFKEVEFILDKLGYPKLNKIRIMFMPWKKVKKIIEENDLNYKTYDFFREYIELNKELLQLNIHNYDLHQGNLGYKPNGSLAVFDIMTRDDFKYKNACSVYNIEEQLRKHLLSKNN